jgi:hypothetical protein
MSAPGASIVALGGLATFNILHGYSEAILRGLRSGFLKDSDYHHLTQCETLEVRSISPFPSFVKQLCFSWCTLSRECLPPFSCLNEAANRPHDDTRWRFFSKTLCVIPSLSIAPCKCYLYSFDMTFPLPWLFGTRDQLTRLVREVSSVAIFFHFDARGKKKCRTACFIHDSNNATMVYMNRMSS